MSSLLLSLNAIGLFINSFKNLVNTLPVYVSGIHLFLSFSCLALGVKLYYICFMIMHQFINFVSHFVYIRVLHI